ncbi:MAG TPA: hypothetical protein VFD43_08350 [Planctomycetota bacterium]|nr:hypothetical protein [Planctomycetota bacterium]
MSIGWIRPLTVGLALLAPAAPAIAGVIIVDPNGFGDFTTIQAAIDAAADGDIVVVRPVSGCCDTASIVGKSLTLVADVGPGEHTARLDLEIIGVPAGGQVVVRGFHAPTTSSIDTGALLVQDCEGSVWIEDCEFKGDSGMFSVREIGAEIRNSPSVSFTRCTIAGTVGVNGNPSFPPFPGTPGAGGALIVDSAVAFHDCSLTAGGGGGSTFFGGEDGGHGVELANSAALLSGCTVVGGYAGFGGGGATGGDGLLLDATSTADVLDTTITGGGTGGIDIDAPPDAVHMLSGSERSMMIPGPKREGQGGLMVVSGALGDVVGFFWSLRGAALPVLGKNGWFLLDPSLLAGPFGLGVITSPDGVWNILFSTPSLPAALEGLTFLVQPYFSYPGGVTLGGGTAFVVLDIGL